MVLIGLTSEINPVHLSIDSLKSKKTKTHSKLNMKDTLKIINEEVEIEEFVKKIYASLELSKELNQKNYEEGGVKFDLTKFLTFLDKDALYSKERIENLSGDYHDRYYIELLSIDSIGDQGDHKNVYVTVMYWMYETGTFYNKEKLSIHKIDGAYKLFEWNDLGIIKMELSGYPGLEKYSEKDFYSEMGSINR